MPLARKLRIVGHSGSGGCSNIYLLFLVLFLPIIVLISPRYRFPCRTQRFSVLYTQSSLSESLSAFTLALLPFLLIADIGLLPLTRDHPITPLSLCPSVWEACVSFYHRH